MKVSFSYPDSDLFVDNVVGFPLPEPPAVTVVATDPNADEAGDPGRFTLSRTGDLSAPLTVLFDVSGTAAAGLDYAALPASAFLGAGVASTTLDVLPLFDLDPEPAETVVVTLRCDAAYVVAAPLEATVVIADNDWHLTAVHRTWEPRDGLGLPQTGDLALEHPLDLDQSPGTAPDASMRQAG